MWIDRSDKANRPAKNLEKSVKYPYANMRSIPVWTYAIFSNSYVNMRSISFRRLLFPVRSEFPFFGVKCFYLTTPQQTVKVRTSSHFPDMHTNYFHKEQTNATRPPNPHIIPIRSDPIPHTQGHTHTRTQEHTRHTHPITI